MNKNIILAGVVAIGIYLFSQAKKIPFITAAQKTAQRIRPAAPSTVRQRTAQRIEAMADARARKKEDDVDIQKIIAEITTNPNTSIQKIIAENPKIIEQILKRI